MPFFSFRFLAATMGGDRVGPYCEEWRHLFWARGMVASRGAFV